MYININCQIIIIIDWGEVSNMCGARCLIGRGEASKGARCPRGRDVNWGEMSGSRVYCHCFTLLVSKKQVLA